MSWVVLYLVTKFLDKVQDRDRMIVKVIFDTDL